MNASPVLRLSTTPPSWSELTRLSTSHDIRDRAFASGELRIRHARGADAIHRAQASTLYASLRAHALRAHAPIRDAIARGTLRGAALREHIEACPVDIRDHFVEELLDIAYPALEAADAPWPRHMGDVGRSGASLCNEARREGEAKREGEARREGEAGRNGEARRESEHAHELVPYAPSGVGEILHALDAVKPAAGDTFVDLGAGLGKVVLLTALLTDARACGVELDPALVAHARASASSLCLAEPRVQLVEADAREADLEAGTIFYMYVPFTGSVLDMVMTRLAHLAERRPLVICAHALDTQRFSWLKNRNEPRFWLDVYGT
ncbi:hypothetical protein [Pendulispora albinea]|uniref:DOT1 domain-containing protein n=1 Tax=Pendulispora albinea TaxID=2741071 RepID=A0ABZ2LVL3_9BACT